MATQGEDKELSRLSALLACDVLDTPPEASFDDIAKLAGILCDTPIALVSLVDAKRQWFKARVGLSAPETGRDISFCGYVVESTQAMVVHDALEDPRFAHNPLVLGDPRVRFYAGVPLTLHDGSVLGTLCVIDHVPRNLSAEQFAALESLARQVSATLDQRREQASTRITYDALPPAMSLVPGEARGILARRYHLEHMLGFGGMGFVVSARDEVTDTQVAIKFLHSDLADDPATVDRFVTEVRSLLHVGGDCFVRVLDAGNLANGAPYFVMERLEGRDLADLIDALGILPVGEAVHLIRQACHAVAIAHRAGVLHRDLKPENLFLARHSDGGVRLKVLDFGVAKFFGVRGATDATKTPAYGYVGTANYMSPEQACNSPELDARCDVWSLGVILYELITGKVPFPGSSVMQVFGRALTMEPTRLEEMPVGLKDVVRRALAKKAVGRWQSVEAFSEALAPFDGGALPDGAAGPERAP